MAVSWYYYIHIFINIIYSANVKYQNCPSNRSSSGNLTSPVDLDVAALDKLTWMTENLHRQPITSAVTCWIVVDTFSNSYELSLLGAWKKKVITRSMWRLSRHYWKPSHRSHHHQWLSTTYWFQEWNGLCSCKAGRKNWVWTWGWVCWAQTSAGESDRSTAWIERGSASSTICWHNCQTELFNSCSSEAAGNLWGRGEVWPVEGRAISGNKAMWRCGDVWLSAVVSMWYSFKWK